MRYPVYALPFFMLITLRICMTKASLILSKYKPILSWNMPSGNVFGFNRTLQIMIEEIIWEIFRTTFIMLIILRNAMFSYKICKILPKMRCFLRFSPHVNPNQRSVFTAAPFGLPSSAVLPIIVPQKIYCHINQCNESVKYFVTLHTEKYCTPSEKPRKLKIHSF